MSNEIDSESGDELSEYSDEDDEDIQKINAKIAGKGGQKRQKQSAPVRSKSSDTLENFSNTYKDKMIISRDVLEKFGKAGNDTKDDDYED